MDDKTEYVFTVIVTTTGKIDPRILRRSVADAVEFELEETGLVRYGSKHRAIKAKVISGRPKVRIEVLGGVAEVAKCPDHVDVTIKDYDDEGR